MFVHGGDGAIVRGRSHGEERVKERLSPLPGAPNVGEWSVKRQGSLEECFEHWGLEATLDTCR